MISVPSEESSPKLCSVPRTLSETKDWLAEPVAAPKSGTSVAKPIPSHRLATIRQTSTTQGFVPRALKNIRRTLFTRAHPLGETDGRIARTRGLS